MPRPDDHLLILSNKENLAWAVEYLTPSENRYLAYAAKDNINYVFFPKEHRGIIVQFVEIADETNPQKEAYRIAGNDIISALTHYKMEALTLINEANKGFTMEYVEGIVLGSYRFTKYFSEQEEQAKRLKKNSGIKKCAFRSSISGFKCHPLRYL